MKAHLDNIGDFPFGERLEHGNKEEFVQRYQVGNAAFGLLKTMLKCHDGAPPGNTLERNSDRATVNSRRAVECAFRRLKGMVSLLQLEHLLE